MTLSKQITLLLIMINSQAWSFGQGFENHIGIKGGLNISTLSGTKQGLSNPNYDKRIGKNFEIFIDTKINKRLTFQSAGLEFSSQGAKKNGFQAFPATDKYAQYFPPGQLPGYLYANVNKEKSLNYLFLTSILRIHSNLDSKTFIKPYLSAGYYIGYLLSGKETMTGTSIIYKDLQEAQPLTNNPEVFNRITNVKDELHKFNMGVNGSIGFFVDINRIRIYIEGGGSYGLLNINKQTDHGKNYINSLTGRCGISYDIGQILLKVISPSS